VLWGGPIERSTDASIIPSLRPERESDVTTYPYISKEGFVLQGGSIIPLTYNEGWYRQKREDVKENFIAQRRQMIYPVFLTAAVTFGGGRIGLFVIPTSFRHAEEPRLLK
jgi:hypothetical protein